MVEFAAKRGRDAKDSILDAANKQLTIIIVKQKNEEARLARLKRDQEVKQKEIREGKETKFENENNDDWGRGSNIAAAKQARQEEE